MYSEECSDVAGSKEVHGDEGCCCEDTGWIPGNGSSQGVPITKADESCHSYSGTVSRVGHVCVALFFQVGVMLGWSGRLAWQ